MRVIDYTEDGKEERRVLTEMVVSTPVLERIAPLWTRDGLFAGEPANIVGGWCVKHLKRFGTAPGREILKHYENWHRGKDDDRTGWINDFLQRLSEEYERSDRPDIPSAIDTAQTCFNRAALQRFARDIDAGASNGQLPKLLEQASNFSPIVLGGAGIQASDIEMKPVRWLWPLWLARGELALVDGLPGQGKTTLWQDLAARTTRGWPMPPKPTGEEVRRPAAVVVVSMEDSWEHGIVPRLMAAGADLEKVIRPEKETVTFPRDVPAIENIIRKSNARLLVVDPIMACVGDNRTDANAETHVRHFLEPLKVMVRKTQVAALLVRHFRKDNGSAIHRGIGSQAWTAMARLQHVVGDPDGSGTVVLANAKSNLAERPQSLGFRIEKTTVYPPDANRKGRRFDCDTSRIAWTGEVESSANDVASAQRKRGRPGGKRDEAVELIRELLADGPMDSAQLQRRVMDELGVSEKTFKLARQEAGVVSRRDGFGGDGKWMSTLP